MNKIILVGLVDNHHSLYKELLTLLSSKFNKITFLTDYKIVKQIDNVIDKNIVTILLDSGRIDKVIKRNLKLINNHNILIMDEYYGLFIRLAKINIKCEKKIFLVHNVNKWFQEKFRYNFKSFLDYFFKKKFFNQFDAYITMGPNVREYFRVFKNDKPVFFFPFDQSSEEVINKETKKEIVDIVLPGMISERRRNYKGVLKILKRYYNDYPNSGIRIKFLGRILSAKDNFIAEVSDNINKKFGDKISYWDTFIPDNEFENEIKNADFLLSNLNVYNDLGNRVEIYGITKESGISFIIYKYAKIAIVPRSQNILSGFDSQLIKFDCYDDLYKIFRKIENNEIDLEKLRVNANKNKHNFNNLIINENIKLMEFLTKG